MKKLILTLCCLIVLMVSVQAAPPVQEEGQDYVVQASDWLSKLADKYYGDILAWPAIWLATNNKAETDTAYTAIDNPDVIEIGQTLWIPTVSEANTLLAGYNDSQINQTGSAAMPSTSDTTDETMMDETSDGDMAEDMDAETEGDAADESMMDEGKTDDEAMMDEAKMIAETTPTILAVTEPLASQDAEISGLTWYGDYLILLPQYPDYAVEEGDGFIFAIARADLEAVLDGNSSDPLDPIQIPFDDADTTADIDGFEGFEAIAFVGDTAYLTIESETDSGITGYIVMGEMAPDLSGLTLSAAVMPTIAPQTDIVNMSEESLLVAEEGVLITFYEANGAEVNSAPVGHTFDSDLANPGEITFPNVEYRVTDATTLDSDNTFWVINYLFPGEEVLIPASDPVIKAHGIGETHAQYPHVERLVEMAYTASGIILTDTPPIYLSLPGEDARNWEGIAELEGRGFIIATDKYPETILAFVPVP